MRYLGPHPGSQPALLTFSGSFGLRTVSGTSAEGSVLARQPLSTAPPSMEPLTHGKPSHPEPLWGPPGARLPHPVDLGQTLMASWAKQPGGAGA